MQNVILMLIVSLSFIIGLIIFVYWCHFTETAK